MDIQNFLNWAFGQRTTRKLANLSVAVACCHGPFALRKEFWGQGLATEVAQALVDHGFEHLKLARLVCVIDQENEASIRVAKKIGMSFEKEGKDKIGPFLLYSRNK